MAKKLRVPTLPQLARITKKETLWKEMDRLARRANDRLLQLERAGSSESSPAYRAAMDMLSGDRFTRSKNLSPAQMRNEIKKSIRFLNMQTSTVKGENARVDKVFDTLVDRALIDEKTDKKAFGEFLKSPAWKQLKNIDSSQIMGEASVAIANGASVDDLMKAWEQYEETGEGTELEVFENWTEIQYGEDIFGE